MSIEWFLSISYLCLIQKQKVSFKCCLHETLFRLPQEEQIMYGLTTSGFPPGTLWKRHCHYIHSLHTLPKGDHKYTAASGEKILVYGTNTQGLLVQTT